MRKNLWGLLMPLIFFGCTASRFAMRDNAAAVNIRTIAIMPFFDANLLSVEIKGGGLLTKRTDRWTSEFIAESGRNLSNRFTFIYGPVVEAELIKLGNYKGYVDGAGKGQRTGYTIADALKAGEALKADAVLIGAATVADTKAFQQVFKEAMSVRILDVKTGKIIYGASAYKKGTFDGRPIPKIVKEIKTRFP